MAACKTSVRTAILDNVNSFLAENRYTIRRISDDTFQINSKLDNSKSKAKSNAQAYQIAQNMVERVDKEYYGHVSGYISEPSPYEPISVTFSPSEAYIQHELEDWYKNNNQGVFFQTNNQVNYALKAVQSTSRDLPKIEALYKKIGDNNTFWNKLQADYQIPKQQME